jgi:hypothetical protein
MPNKAWLDRKVVRFLNFLGLTNVTQTVVVRSFEETRSTETKGREEES